MNVKSYSKKAKAVGALAASGDDRAVPVLEALGAGLLFAGKGGKPIVIKAAERSAGDGTPALTDAITGAPPSRRPPPARSRRSRSTTRCAAIKRGARRAHPAQSRSGEVRANAAEAVFRSADRGALDTLETKAIAQESLPKLKAGCCRPRRRSSWPARTGRNREAGGDRDRRRARRPGGALALLSVAGGEDPVARAAKDAAAAARSIEQRLEAWQAAQNVIYGLSLGSVLLLAAIGLAITFGVMGVINMAHGEMVMIGAYVTFMSSRR